MKKTLLIIIFFNIIFVIKVLSQNAIGLRFVSDFNYFYKPEEYNFINNYFSNAALGLTYKKYFENGIIDLGLTYGWKNRPGNGVNLPLVQRNFNKNDTTVLSFLEFHFLVGPRFGVINFPKFGFNVGRRFEFSGVYAQGTPFPQQFPISLWHFSFPVGFSFDLPTSFGTTGGAFYVDIGLNNLIPDVGGRIRAIVFEIHVALSDQPTKKHLSR